VQQSFKRPVAIKRRRIDRSGVTPMTNSKQKPNLVAQKRPADAAPVAPAPKVTAPQVVATPTPEVAAKAALPVAATAAPEVAVKAAPEVAVKAAVPVAAKAAPEVAVKTAPVVAPKPEARPSAAVAKPVPVASVEHLPKIPKPVVEALASPVRSEPASKPPQPLTSKVSKMTTTPTFNGYDNIAAFGKANMDALIQANKVFAKGLEEISKEVLHLTQSSIESATAATKAMFAAKSLKDVVELNANFTKSHFDKLVTNSTKLGEMGVKLATDTIAPITARVNTAVEKSVKPAA
jgi:phasin family protein